MSQEIERLEHLFEETGHLENFEGLKLSASKTAALLFADGVEVMFEYVSSRAKLYLYTPLFSMPRDPAQRLHLLESMLRCNFLRLDTNGAEFALSFTGDDAICQAELDTSDLNAALFGRAIHDFRASRTMCLDALERIHTSRRIETSASRHAASFLLRSVQRRGADNHSRKQNTDYE
jgi:hypothetical protein